MSKPSRSIVHEFAEDVAAHAAAFTPYANADPMLVAEAEMVIKLGKEFGVDVDEAAYKILAECHIDHINRTVSESTKAIDLAYPLIIPVRIAIAMSILEAVGNAVYDYLDKNYS